MEEPWGLVIWYLRISDVLLRSSCWNINSLAGRFHVSVPRFSLPLISPQLIESKPRQKWSTLVLSLYICGLDEVHLKSWCWLCPPLSETGCVGDPSLSTAVASLGPCLHLCHAQMFLSAFPKLTAKLGDSSWWVSCLQQPVKISTVLRKEV